MRADEHLSRCGDASHSVEAEGRPVGRLRAAGEAGFDEPGVHRPDGDFVDAVAGDFQEGAGPFLLAEGGRFPGVWVHGVPTLGPVEVPYQAAGQRVIQGNDAVQVVHFALEPACGEGQMGQAGHLGAGGSRRARVELDAGVGRPGDEEVDEAYGVCVVVGGDQGQAVAVAQQRLGPLGEFGGVDVVLQEPASTHLTCTEPPNSRACGRTLSGRGGAGSATARCPGSCAAGPRTLADTVRNGPQVPDRPPATGVTSLGGEATASRTTGTLSTRGRRPPTGCGLRRYDGGFGCGRAACRSASSSACPARTPDRMVRATRSSSATCGLVSE